MSAKNTFSAASQLDKEFYATCGGGLDALLAEEFNALGFAGVQRAGAGVRFLGPLTEGYRACLWSRLANRILLPIHNGPASSPEELYDLIQEIDWSEHMDVEGSLAVDFFTANSLITHSQYGALKVKDAVVDQFRLKLGRRPDVDRDTPDIRINVYLFRNKARVAIDLSGTSLHRRGYRNSAGLAPLKENLAAALLLASDWPAAINNKHALFDPLCGSGTLLIEAAMIATNKAPGLLRNYFGFLGWKQHDEPAWQSLLADAQGSVCESPVVIAGADQDPQVIESCRSNLESAGLEHCVSVHCHSVQDAPAADIASQVSGLLITNPPYGERLATNAKFYADMGADFSRHFAGWSCSLFTAATAPFSRARLPLSVVLETRNGGIDCVLLTGQIPSSLRAQMSSGLADCSSDDLSGGGSSGGASTNLASSDSDSSNNGDSDLETAAESSSEHPQAALYRKAAKRETTEPSGHAALTVDATAFVNRVKKNQRALKGWLKQQGIDAYRVYDADLPDFAVAIDIYNAEQVHCVVQEYQAPSSVNVAMARARLEQVMASIPAVLGIDPERVHLKVRQIQSGSEQYEKLSSTASKVIHVQELGARHELNLSDYLDTGLFLDHRPVRRFISNQSQGKRFLNLFAYTATATVAAVVGGAASSVSVDSSNRYCQWARRNLDNNEAAAQCHEVVRQDAFSWLEAAGIGLAADKLFDLVLLDPPTFSNSTDLTQDWNLQRDHVAAIDACLAVMAPGALLIFSNNYRRFKLDTQILNSNDRNIRIEDRSRWSIDRDFQRHQRIHQCWFIHKT